MTNWSKFIELLRSQFDPHDLDQNTLQHLEHAYHEIERMWFNFNQDLKPQRVLIGEATLFREGSYIYNPATPNSSFLRPTDFPGEPSGDKDKLLQLLKCYGLLIIDAYPFAFNDQDTPHITYNKRLKSKKFQGFLIEAFNLYCAPKIIRILNQNPAAKISFRYKRNDKILGAELDRILKLHSHFQGRSPSVYKQISIDKKKFQHFLGN
ncbi:hypothetical protein LSUCC1028_00465 [Rhodobacterales bacterium LSUCC1028]|nr:hypothetical protein [Rhodobacterales bacterium LSUCC1028]